MIKQELQHPIDKHSRELIVSNIELLLNYCLRFYDRQFITRVEINHSVVKKFISLLDEYIARQAMREGLPIHLLWHLHQLKHQENQHWHNNIKQRDGFSFSFIG